MRNLKYRRNNTDSPLLTYQIMAEDSNLGIQTVMKLAKESGALVKIGKTARVNREKFYSYVLEKYSEINKENAHARKKQLVTEKYDQVVKVSSDAYNALVEIYNESTLSMKDIASLLIIEGSKHVVYDKEE